MTIHEEQPVTAEPRIDDENTADAVHEPEPATDENAANAVHEPEPATDDIGAEAIREPEPATDAVEAEPPRVDHESSTAEMLFAGDDVADLRARWAGVQAAFVDNPKECVQKADHLVSDLVEHLTTGFAEARSRLEEQWSQGQEASTEDLRVALMHYREFFDRLLAV
jgi:phosphoglycolate phosphatase-like HAD superfamily hydrolase